MQYKTELHAHSSEVSPCAVSTATQVVDRYVKEGYTTLVLTNHYCDYVIDNAGETWEEKIEHYLSAYRLMKKYADGRINILLGCELRFTENYNDYLIFGLDEDFLINHPDLHKMTLKSFSELAHENGMLVVQAHPFRNRMTVMNPKFLDGVEVYNAHVGHDSRNDLALMHAKKYGLIPTAGTDLHHHENEVAGILSDAPIETMEQLVALLRSRAYTLICQGTAARRDGLLSDMSAKF